MDCISMFVHIMKENDSRVALLKERLHLIVNNSTNIYKTNKSLNTHTHTHTRYGSWFGTGANTLVNNVVATS